MGKKIRIILKTDGTMSAEAEGFQGANCMAETNRLLETLAKRETDQKLKSDYYVNEAETSIGA